MRSFRDQRAESNDWVGFLCYLCIFIDFLLCPPAFLLLFWDARSISLLRKDLGLDCSFVCWLLVSKYGREEKEREGGIKPLVWVISIGHNAETFRRRKSKGEYKKHIPSLPRQNPISPRLLIPPPPIHKPPLRIDLQAPKNILGERYPAIIRRIPMVVHVDIPASTSPAGSALPARSACSVPAGGGAAESRTGAGPKIEATTRS